MFLKLEVKPKSGLKRDRETHSRSKRTRKAPKSDRPGEESQVQETHDDAVFWDPWKQKWTSIITIVALSPYGKKTYSFSRDTDDFPKDMDVPNTTNAPIEVKLQSDDYLFHEEVEDLTSEGSHTGKQPKESQDSNGMFELSTTGYALGSQMLTEAKHKIYDWKSSTYMLTTPGGKPITPIFDGALVSGAQLNLATGSNRYDTSTLYEINKVEYHAWEDYYGWRHDDPIFTDATSFVNRNKGNGQAEWTPGTVAVTLEAEVISSQRVAESMESNFIPSEPTIVLEQAGYDPADWEYLESQGYSQEEINAMLNNAKKMQDMASMPYELKLIMSSSIAGSLSQKLEWLWALTR